MADTYACGIVMERPEGDLFEILGVDPDIHFGDIKKVGYEIQQAIGLTDDQRYAWKALTDPSYYRLYRATRSTEALYRAGFFDDGLPQLTRDYGAWGERFMSTPVEKIRKHYEAWKQTSIKGEPIVLVTTGGMAPIHKGHIEMMEQARQVLEERGFMVLGGYFAPGHDSYVGQKYGGTAAIPAAHRCAMVELACRNSDWLDCDPWAARYMPAEVNFTDVVNRLETYLYHHVGDIQVFYVYGSDNTGFGAVLPDQSVEIPRTHYSSKAAREGQYDYLAPAVRDYMAGLKDKDTGNLPYLIRNEEDDAIESWRGIHPMEDLTRRRIQLQSAVRLGIAQLFKVMGEDHKVHLLPISEQRIKAREEIKGRKTLSLDPFFSADARMDSTRYFAISEAQQRPLFRAERMGFQKLEEQAELVKPGEYVLVEDDTVTGGTIASTLAILPPSVKIVDQVILSDFADYTGIDYYDVVDLRDFIVGSQHGGLSVILPDGTKARAPYVMPFVSLRSRAKIPAEVEVEVSRIIWQANVRFFADTGIRIQDADPGFRALAHYLGWYMTDYIEDFCRWHVDCLLEPHIG